MRRQGSMLRTFWPSNSHADVLSHLRWTRIKWRLRQKHFQARDHDREISILLCGWRRHWARAVVARTRSLCGPRAAATARRRNGVLEFRDGETCQLGHGDLALYGWIQRAAIATRAGRIHGFSDRINDAGSSFSRPVH